MDGIYSPRYITTEEYDDLKDELKKLHEKILNAYGEAFPNYTFVSSEQAIALMVAEIKSLRGKKANG